MSEEKRQETAANEQPKKKTKEQLYIDEAAKAGAREVLHLQAQQRNINLYRAMERLLRGFAHRVRIAEHPEEFDFFKTGRSKDISVAPPPGTGVVDKIEAAEMFTEARKKAYEVEMYKLQQTYYAIAPFEDKPEFIVIRMYYFNENAYGEPRGGDAKPYTFAEIAEELEAVGIQRSEKILRKWRTKIVQDMTVQMWGADGALSVEAREPKQGQKEIVTEGAKADE
ncbi:MAG: hypothetical protein IKF99_11810 [Oscillospiraceae bacterium]|nr:hypothetical protein [Oscillospiraceae bacterium]